MCSHVHHFRAAPKIWWCYQRIASFATILMCGDVQISAETTLNHRRFLLPTLDLQEMPA